MSTNEPNISDLDYSELYVQMQHTLNAIHKKIQKKRYEEARKAARDLATDALLVGIWCQQFIKKNPLDTK
jgi:hypothetical protein